MEEETAITIRWKKGASNLLIVFLLAALILPLIPIPRARASTVLTLTSPSDDSYIDDTVGGGNYGGANYFYTQGSLLFAKMRTYIRFDLSAIPEGSVIESAVLWLYQTAATDSDAGRIYIIIQAWAEGTITSDNAPNVGSYVSVTLDTTINWVSFDVKDVVSLSANYGYRINHENETPIPEHKHTYTSKEIGATYDPYLVVTYGAPPTIDSLDAPEGAYANNAFYVNATVTDENGIAHLAYVTLEISEGIILNWTQSSDVFSEAQDTSNLCTLDAGNSVSTADGANTIELAWLITLSADFPAGWVDAIEGDTVAMDDDGGWSDDEETNFFYFLLDAITVESAEITDMEGCGAWVFSEEVYYSVDVVLATAIGWDTLDVVAINFSDGVTTGIIEYSHPLDTWTVTSGTDIVSTKVGEAVYGDVFYNLTYYMYLTGAILDELDVDLYVGYGLVGYSISWPYNQTDYFNIYNRGGFGTLEYSGDAGRLEGGDIFDLFAGNNSYAQSNVTFRKLQQWHLYFRLYGNKVQFDEQEGDPWQITFGIYICPDGEEWINGWKVVLETDPGDTVWIGDVFLGASKYLMTWNVTWYERNSTTGDWTLIRGDTLVSFPVWDKDASAEECYTAFWIDFWFNQVNASSIGGGRVNAEYYGVWDKDINLFAAEWDPVLGNVTQSMYFRDLKNTAGDTIHAPQIKMMRPFVRIEQGVNADRDNYFTLREYDVLDFAIAPNVMTGIPTPIVVSTKMPDMPTTDFFSALISAFQHRMKSIWIDVISPVLSIATDTLDWAAAGVGLPPASTFFATIVDFLTHFGDAVATALAFLTPLFQIVVGTVDFIIDIFTSIVVTFLQIAGFVGGILDGTASVATGVGNMWTWINLGDWISAVPTFMIIAWFVSLDSRAKRGYNTWMGVFVKDIGDIMAVFSFILDLSFRIITFIFNAFIGIINILIPG